jgi:spore coat protein CotF
LNIVLSTKEKLLLEDAKSHEQLCIEKYSNYANHATDQQLKDIFENHARIEAEHLNTINQLLNNQIPSLNNQQNSGNSKQLQQTTIQNQGYAGMTSISDKQMCDDVLMTEKYVSSTYDTAIFEFRDTNVRDILNHIQKEEQKHGEAIFKYMESKGMYTVQ